MFMKKILNYYFIVFGIGFFGYGLLEVLWRGRTHISMSIAGGIIFCIISKLQLKFYELKTIYQCLITGMIITSIELIFGLFLNTLLNQNIWDYSMFPLNFLGQICLLYSVLWCFLALPILKLSKILKTKLLFKKHENMNNLSFETS